MRKVFFCYLTLILFVSCKKENSARVDIYLLKSFNTTVNQTTTPATIAITNAVLSDTPLVAGQDIEYYTSSTTTFTLKKDIQTVIKDYGADKGFAVTVDKQPIYYGVFHPMYLSSMVFGVATIAPFPFINTELKIDFVIIDGNSTLQNLDRRNDSRLLSALKDAGKLR